jgi:2'-5' RNA ligase
VAEVRTFIAIELEAPVRDAISHLIEQLRGVGADVRWVPSQNLHLTLKFLGNVDDRRIDSVTEGVRDASSDIERFELTLSGVGAFPSLNRPRVIWVGLHSGAEAIREITRRIETVLEGKGFKREEREFSPHLTIGRVSSLRGVQSLVACVDRMSFVGPAMVVDRIAIMKSDLRPTGPIYTRLAVVQLHSPVSSCKGV